MNFLDERLPERFWNKVIPEPNSGCWLWIGATSNKGYGYFTIRRPHSVRVHRMTYEVIHGQIVSGLDIDHLCRTRCCCNPMHMEAVTRQVNLLRGDTHASANAAKTHCKRGHALTADNIRPSCGPRRACRECARLRQRGGL